MSSGPRTKLSGFFNRLFDKSNRNAVAPSGSEPPSTIAPLLNQYSEHGMFSQAHGLVFNNAQFNNNPHFNNVSPDVGSGAGLRKLLKHSMPDAFHDSAARYPPPKCHLSTRKEYIAQITDWAAGNSDHEKPVLWMHGPFGVGKSAVAQTNRSNPRQVFTSIAYQIATQCKAYAIVIDTRIREDPALTTKSLATQFEELLVIPLCQIDVTKEDFDGRVVIIDGLDECRGVSEQREIIKIIAASARMRTTPFRWLITSRPEEPIIRTMHSPSVSPIISCIELPVSREIDHEILIYLIDEFEKIREHNGLAETWPPEDTLALLVERADGLWIYASTITRFVNDDNSLGPEHQLRLVLEFTLNVSRVAGMGNPLAEMDVLYTLIMQQIPPTIRVTLQKILLIQSMDIVYYPRHIASSLRLSVEQFRRCCAAVHSVMRLSDSAKPTLDEMRLQFYHASFLEFLTDPRRSQDLCVHGVFLTCLRAELLEWLHSVYSYTKDHSEVILPSATALPKEITASDCHRYALDLFWELCCMSNHPIDTSTATLISRLPFRKIFSLLPGAALRNQCPFVPHDCTRIMRENLPTVFRDKIARIGKCPNPRCMNPNDVVVLGEGANEVITPYAYDAFYWANNQNVQTDICPCGGQIRREGDKESLI
ncbi:hypothetical protein NP233_g6587 [Leucocoprinus birnbaumii]|uniref:Nephrocystin 3-like N-terminal domain-containing protein n=1 Tax=Leucocoprinus birnbaumii TaxID=56174 RepID=A0AAD5VUA8_9AGAR|nr:hypothetical protein NP233_g6587 [Leucocoprinus birnbaumii]